jgi:PAS domain S-box-containing protein
MKNLLLSISKANNHLLKEHSINDALNFCISDIGFGQEIDRCYIFKNEIDDGVLKLYYVHEWCNAGIEPYLGSPDLNGIPYDSMPGLYHSLSRDKPMHGLVKDSDNILFKETMKMQGIKSYLFTPIFSDNRFWGWIGYDDCKNERKWIDEEVYALHTIAKNIGLRLNQDRIVTKLEHTLEQFDYYMLSSNQAMWEMDIETNKTIISYNWAGMLGYTNEEIIDVYSFWEKSVHPEDLIRILIDLKYYIAGKLDSYEGIARIIHREGHYIWVKYSGLLIKKEDGTPKKIIGTHIDISQLKEKENQLELSESKFRFIADNTTDLICQHSNDGSFVYVSSSSTEIVGYTPEELIHNKPSDFIHTADLRSIENYYNSIIKNNHNGIITFRFKNKNGSYIWLETSTKVIVDAEKQVLGFQTSSRDISERIKANMEIKAAFSKEKKFNELKSKFVSMASHQFRTPLTVIYSNAEILELKTTHFEKKVTDEFKLITSRIKNEVDRMTELMNNILIFGKHESKNIETKIQPIDFNKFIKTLIKTYFSNNSNNRIIQVITIGKKKIFFIDETLIVHILTNLISNAFKYSIGTSDPLLIITYLENEIEIQVVDYGIGIPEDEIQHLFTSFFRASNTNTIIGSGLGLAIVKQFTELLKGTIELKTKEGFGTKVKLTFPYEQ